MYASGLNKSLLRKMYLEERKSFSKEEIEDYSKIIFENFLKYFDLSEVKKVHCFLPITKFKEINSFLFIDYFWDNNIEVYVPKIVENEIVSIKFEKSTKLIENSWGILEPKSNQDNAQNYFDLVITPLVYCDKNGNRIGYGKGFYDKFFSKINCNTKKIGLSLFMPIQDILDISKEDQPLDYLVTPAEILSFLAGISKSTK